MRYSTVLEHLKGRISTNVEKHRLVRPPSYTCLNRPHLLTQSCQKLLEVAGGVAYLHHQNVVHGNLSGVRRFDCYYLFSDDDF